MSKLPEFDSFVSLSKFAPQEYNSVLSSTCSNNNGGHSSSTHSESFGAIISSLFMLTVSFGYYTLAINNTKPITIKSNKKKTKSAGTTANQDIDQRFQQSKKPTKEEKRLAKELYKNRKPKPINQVLSPQKLDLINNKQKCSDVGKEISLHLSERRYINQKKWNCMSRPQYKYSCGISSLTAIWNFLFSTIGEGSLPPLTQEEVLEVLGFSEPYEKIRFGPFTGNQTIMLWFEELLKAFGCKGSSSIFWKCKGDSVAIPQGNIKEELKNGIKGKKTAFIYHCYNHYMVLIGYEESSDTPSQVYEKEIEKTNTWFLIGDNSRLQEPVESVKFSDIEKDLNQEGPFFFNIRHPEKGIQKKGSKSRGNVNCIMKFMSGSPAQINIPPEKMTKFDKSRKKAFEIVWAEKQPETTPPTLRNNKLSNTIPLCDRFISNRSSSNLRYGLSSPNHSQQSSSSMLLFDTTDSYHNSLPTPVPDTYSQRTATNLSPSSISNYETNVQDNRVSHLPNRPRSAPLVNSSSTQQTSSPDTSLRRTRSHSLNSSSSSYSTSTIVDSNNALSLHQHRTHTTPSRTLSRAGSGYSSPRGATSNNSTQLSIGSLSESGRSNSLNNSTNSLSSINSLFNDASYDDAIFNSNGLSSDYDPNLRNSGHSADNFASIDDFLTSTHSRTSLFDYEQENSIVCEDTIPPSRVPNSFNLDGVLVGGKGDAFDTLLMTELLPNSQTFNNNSYLTLSETPNPVSYNRRTRSTNASPVKRTKTSPNSNILNFSPNNTTSNNSVIISRRQTYNSNKGTPEPAFSMLIHPNNTVLTKNGINLKTNKILALPKSNRLIPEKPIRVLDAPGLRNDFYLNLLDWGESDLMAVVLNTNVFLWNANNHSVSSLLSTSEDNTITSVSWMKTDPYILATGNEEGFVSIYDVQKEKKIRDVHKHNDRVGRLVWNGYCLTSGSRDNQILISDIRTKNSLVQLSGHTQEICGLKWNNVGKQLASGGNDNNLFVWEPQHNSRYPIWKISDGHNSAIKALSWSPYDSNLLVSGGGVSDRCMKFWDTSSGQLLSTKKTSSQICNIYWSKFTNEIVTTHGLMSQNHITIWSSYPELNPVSTLYGHTERVLYLTASPDGSQIVTGSGDETIRFWSIFPSRDVPSQDIISKVSLDIR